MALPGVTFIIPCFNYGRFVAEAVESALGQEGVQAEAIVVDDGSDDGVTPGACDALASERVRVIHQSNAGPGAARNRGAREARTPYIVFLDADDTVDARFASTLIAAIEDGDGRGEKVSHAYCHEVLTDQATGMWKVPAWDPLLLMATNLHPITTVVRRACFEEVGGFEESLGGNYEDWDLWLKLSFRGYRGVRVAEPLFLWRRHSQDTMVMRAVKSHDQTYARIVERHIEQYKARSLELVRLYNSLLRKFDCNWIDETGYPIPLQYLWSLHEKLNTQGAKLAALDDQNGRLRDMAQRSQAMFDGQAERLKARYEDELRTQREHYESYAVMRLHRAWHGVMRRLPGPLAWMMRVPGNVVRRLVPKRASRRASS